MPRWSNIARIKTQLPRNYSDSISPKKKDKAILGPCLKMFNPAAFLLSNTLEKLRPSDIVQSLSRWMLPDSSTSKISATFHWADIFFHNPPKIQASFDDPLASFAFFGAFCWLSWQAKCLESSDLCQSRQCKDCIFWAPFSASLAIWGL